MKNIQVPSNLPGDVLWGVEAIAAYIKRKRSATYYLIAKGFIPAKKLGRRTIIARKSELDHALVGDLNRLKGEE